MRHLVSYKSQIETNLRRTASKGLISLLNQQQLENLAFKYFGIKDEYGNIIGYQCPYSGKTYTDYKDIVLEHIVPVVSNGGTVLFNCIPTSKEVNGADQKGAKHLITWWLKSKYWNQEAPLRLEKIVNYMLDAYDQVFNEYTIEEVESSYLDIETDESTLDEEDNLEYSEANESKLLKQAKNNGIHSYLGFILDCINTLENKEICNIDTTDIRRKLTELQDNHIFEDIERYQLFQNIIQKLIISRIGDDNHSYLTYSLNFDIKKLMDSIKSNNPEEIYNELNIRLQNIEQLLKQNNLSAVEYFKSLKDIQDIDIIYKSNISEEEINIFLENIKLGIDTKIGIFIEMLTDKQYTSYENGKVNDNNIFSNRNKVTFKGYENIKGLNTSYFWYHNLEAITKRLNYLENNSKSNEEREKYQKAKRAIEEFKFQCKKSGLMLRIDCFIEMLTDKLYTSYKNGVPNENNIFKKKNKIPFKGYEGIDGLNISEFWSDNSKEIIKRLNCLEKNSKSNEEREKYRRAREAIDKYNFTINLDKRIDKFIEMLTFDKYTSYENGIPNEDNIFSSLNKILFKDFESIDGLNTSTFWSDNSKKIIKRLNYLESNSKSNEEREKYQRAREAIDKYNFTIDLDKRIDKFIEMLTFDKYTSYEKGKPNNHNIFTALNKVPFNGYENIEGLNTSYFWNHNSKAITKRLNYLENNSKSDKEREKYQRVRKAIREYEFQCQKSGLMLRIGCYIEMLTDKLYTSYKNGAPNENNIFNQRNKVPFKGYERIAGLNTSQFWNVNSQKIIIPLLFFNKQYDGDTKSYIDSTKNYSTKEYDSARNAVLEYLSITDKTTYTNIEQYIDKLEQKEKKNAKILELINLRNNLRKTLELLRIQESKLITENNQLNNEYIQMQEGIEIRRAV